MKLFHAYLVTCRQTGKQYVGITSRPVLRRWIEHLHGARRHRQRSAFLNAIAKHGHSAFTVETICCARSWNDICAAEAQLISQHGTLSPRGYNLTLGGEGRFGYRPSTESIEQSAAKHRGRPCHENTRAAAVRAHLGKRKTDIHRARIAASKIGIPRTTETKDKIRAYWVNRRARGDFKTVHPYEHHAK